MSDSTEIIFSLPDLLIVFDELLPISNEQQKDYWLCKRRADGTVITLNFSAYENQAGVIIRSNSDISPVAVDIKSCAKISVVDGKFVEIIGGDCSGVRLFLSMEGSNILDVRIP